MVDNLTRTTDECSDGVLGLNTLKERVTDGVHVPNLHGVCQFVRTWLNYLRFVWIDMSLDFLKPVAPREVLRCCSSFVSISAGFLSFE